MRTGLKTYGPYRSGSSGALAVGAEATLSIPHDLGRRPAMVLGALVDGSYSSGFSWRWSATDRVVNVNFRNLGTAGGSAELIFVLLAP